MRLRISGARGKLNAYARQVQVQKLPLLRQFSRLSQQTKAQSLSTAKDRGPRTGVTEGVYLSTSDFVETGADSFSVAFLQRESVIV